MIRALILTVALAIVIMPTRVDAYGYTCDEIIDFATSGNARLEGVTAGYAVGTIDFLAGLYCYIGHQQCNCLANVFDNRPGDLGTAFANRLTACRNSNGSAPAFGAALQAARDLCPF